ncbi:hypothetical protein [Herbidospora mongoliensis]|uniref:hypothetical protein n=1 Tax=Herbidospora mongoliensis TaxID=688067 RepID=UPI00082F6DC8|nr:hypothetical protein [Herbidospora mongoliensis]
MDWLASIPWGGSLVALGVGLVVGTLGLVIRGQLIPKSRHDELVAAANKRGDDLVAVAKQRGDEKAQEASEFRAAWMAAEAARREQGNQVSTLLEYARVTDGVMRALYGRALGESPADPREESGP